MFSNNLGEELATWLQIAWLLPLIGFAIEIFAGYWSHRLSRAAAYLAVGCIAAGFLCSVIALVTWGDATDWAALHPADHHGETAAARISTGEHAETAHDEHGHAGGDHAKGHGEDAASHSQTEHAAAHPSDGKFPADQAFSGTFYTLAQFDDLVIAIDYYIDSLTLVMFAMVTLIATCIHIFAVGYMSGELTEDFVDHQVHTRDGGHLHRPGRYYQFFAYMSLFSFSMLGLVLAGNIFQVFVFWELVGICSYLLIGFYVERKSASTAANKAFIMNRVGDFGFLIGLMVIWTWFGTFRFADHEIKPISNTQVAAAGQQDHAYQYPGLFTAVRGSDGQLKLSEDGTHVLLHKAGGELAIDDEDGVPAGIPYWLLIVAGLGVFAGCIGKSAQFPLQTWLPDAMEGPTPVSALVHSATMVAAGVYLVGRFYPLFTPEVLLVIAYVGCITLFLAATIAIVATDIKRVLAYSTISQLGYMMLALGVAGWGAGLFHLITHAFFKSLMFLCAGSVIVACHHEQEMTRMGGLWRKLPITAGTMLVGVVAICGLAIPGINIYGATGIAFSGYHSKDAIVATALAYANLNPIHFLLFLIPLVTAGITAFYMFRLWFYTFIGEPRDKHLYDHAHESPLVMTGPLIVLAVFAALCAVGGEGGPLYGLLTGSEPAHVAAGATAAGLVTQLNLPGHDAVHAVHAQAGVYALFAAILGTLIAFVLYGKKLVDPAEIKRHFAGVYGFLVEKWQFDNLYDAMFVRPVHVVAAWCTAIDRVVFDGFLHRVARGTVDVSRWDRRFDEAIVDGLVNLLGDATFAAGRSLRVVQTGLLRQYVRFIAVGVLVLFVVLFLVLPK